MPSDEKNGIAKVLTKNLYDHAFTSLKSAGVKLNCLNVSLEQPISNLLAMVLI
jgi:hypothetical protein